MRIFVYLFIFLTFSSATLAQKSFEIKDASKYFDIKIKVEDCDESGCQGKGNFSFYKKGTSTPYQVIEHEETYIDLEWEGKIVTENLPYKTQAAVDVGDYNFDGMEDVAICNGRYGNYGARSYDVYLSSKSAGKFVHNEALSELGQNYMGLFDVNKKKKTLSVYGKSGCCFHIEEEYKVVNNRPVKVYAKEEDAMSDDQRVKITTSTLINGKWRTKVRYAKQ
ncbi:MAG: hypothetical protein K1X72_24300 [Pyrinomonadaceae bacterium]|nr:hypothetical protein [Pyrinomonadaceae bacterium]